MEPLRGFESNEQMDVVDHKAIVIHVEIIFPSELLENEKIITEVIRVLKQDLPVISARNDVISGVR